MTTDASPRPGWAVTTFRRVAQVSGGLVDPTDPTYSSMRLIAPNHIESGTGNLLGYESADDQGADSGKYLANAGDILYSKIRPQLNKVTIAPEHCLCSADMYPIHLRSGDARFAVYWMLAKPFLTFASTMADRVKMPKINREELAGAPWVTPPEPEQRAIADFLDRETAKIDALIEKQNQLVGLLRERRESVVESVLRNAGPTGALGFFAHCLPGYAFAAQDFSQDEQDVRLLRGINVKPRATDWSEVVYWPQEAAVAFSSYQLVAGDIVLGMDRPFVGDGTRVAVIDEGDLPCLLLQRVLRVRPRAQVSSKFLYFALMTRSFREYATPEFTGVSVPHISDKQVRSFRLPVPDLGEQENLAARVGADVAKIDALIAKAEEFIALAKERRAALITAAVTGQIDVLGEAS